MLRVELLCTLQLSFQAFMLILGSTKPMSCSEFVTIAELVLSGSSGLGLAMLFTCWVMTFMPMANLHYSHVSQGEVLGQGLHQGFGQGLVGDTDGSEPHQGVQVQ